MSRDKKQTARQAPTQRTLSIKGAPAYQSSFNAYYFNRFKILEDDGFSLLFLGLVFEGEVMSSHVIAMVQADISHCFKISADYIQRLGSVSQEPPKQWDYPRTRQQTVVANMLNFAHAGNVAELSFSNYIIHDLALARNGQSNDLVSGRILVARSNLEIHKQLIGHLFHGLAE